MLMETEIWKDIPWYDWHYQVSSIGRVKSLERTVLRKDGKLHYYSKWRILRCSLDKDWYIKCTLTINSIKKSYFAHRIVITAFIPNPENKSTVNHKNWIRNDNRLENLEWATVSENALHAFRELWRIHNMLWRKWKLSPMFWRRWKDSHMFWRTWKLNWRSKHTQQLDLNWKIIWEFGSANIASRITNISIWNITSCCKWKKANAWWYMWRYKYD
jgi:hypothetical protein